MAPGDLKPTSPIVNLFQSLRASLKGKIEQGGGFFSAAQQGCAFLIPWVRQKDSERGECSQYNLPLGISLSPGTATLPILRSQQECW